MPFDTNPDGKQRRGFAALSPERRREIAAKGGASVPAEKRGFSRYPLVAIEAGRKGGKMSRGGGRRYHRQAVCADHD